jgi:hypothetical protein
MPSRERLKEPPEHKHSCRLEKELPYAFCVNPVFCNRQAHGGRTQYFFCECGSIQLANINGTNVEFGAWKIKEEKKGEGK